MAECARSMLEAWQDDADAVGDHAKEVEVAREFQELTANVISHTAFGSSYSEGKEVFVAQKELQILVIESFLNVNIPGFRSCNHCACTTRNRLRTDRKEFDRTGTFRLGGISAFGIWREE